jgi:WD40 repeat protein
VSWWDLQNAKELRVLLTDERVIVSVALAPDEMSALTNAFESVKRWDLKTGKPTATYVDKAKGGIINVAFLPTGKQFLSASEDGVVRLWSRGQDQPGQTYKRKGDQQITWHVAPSMDGKRFVAADFQASLTVWDTYAAKEIAALRPEKVTIEEATLAATISDDGKTVLAVWGKANPAPDDFACAKLIAWDVDKNKIRWSSIVPYRGRVPLRVQGDRLLVGGGPNPFDVWHIPDGKHMQTWAEHKGAVTALGVRADGNLLSVGPEPRVFVWSKRGLEDKLPPHVGAVTAMTVSKDRQSMLSAGANGGIRHTPPNNGRSIAIASGHKGPITSLAYSTSGKWACSGSGDRSIKTWSVKDGSEIATITGHSEGVNAVAVSPDDRWIASASDDATVRLFPIKDGKPDPDRDVVVLEKHKKAVTCLAFSPDGNRLISGSQDQTLIAWNWKKESMDFIMPGHKNWITSILFLDGKTMLSTSDDLTLCAWDLTTGKEVGRIDFGVVGDCPRCLAQLGPDRFAVGTSSWLIYEFQLLPEGKTKGTPRSSKQ